MYFFFDTETTGVPLSYNAPVTHLSNWPRMVQLAFLVYDKDENKVKEGNCIIKPDGYVIPDSVSRIHGITQEKALAYGFDLKRILERFSVFINGATYLIAHNMDFDIKIIGAEFLRCGLMNPTVTKKKICTMKSTVNFCALPHFKWPKLEELHRILFDCEFEGAHNAIYDVAVMAKCFFELKKREVIKL